MSHDEFDREHPPPTPLWRRPRILGLAAVTAAVIIFIFTHRGGPPPAAELPTNAGIAVAQPYEPPKEPPAPQPPLIPSFKPPKPIEPPKQTAMISYPVKVTPLPPPPAAPPEPDQTTIKFGTATLPGVKASPAIDETYMLMPGLLPIVLDTAINSSWSGPLLGHLPGPVYSPKGVLLMEAMTQCIGKYESLKQSDGVDRLQATNTYCHTPNGVWVPIAGQPLADQLGRAGLSANVDHRLFARFGGAILLDLTQTGLQIIQADVAKGGNTYLNVNGTDQLANQILQSTINLPPIATKDQGSIIAIWLTEPVDFSDSYRVVAR